MPMLAALPPPRRLALACLLPLAAAAQDDGDRVRSLQRVEVIHQTPLPGLDVPLARYPGHAQQADDAAIERAGAGHLADFMNRRLVGVTLNEVQGSPFQIDLSYRGHRLSPLLGTPQGLSVYLDGVRINQPFGDVMNWDLLPEAAIAGLALVPGSNPLYGLNTLGGALVLTTKSGLTHPGTEADLSVGSAGRKRLDFGHGVRWGDGWHGYAAGTLFGERGWRERSPGELGNLFLKLGRQRGDTEWSLSYAHARSRLTGNGLLSQSLYERDPRAGYTFADTTHSRASLLSFALSQALGDGRQLALQAWHRNGRRNGSTGDVSETWTQWLQGCEDAPAASACADPGDPGFVTRGAVVNSSRSWQSETGAGAQWTLRNGAHQWAFGADAATSRTRHDQFTQEAAFDATRAAVPEPGSEPAHEVALRGRSDRVGLYVADIVTLEHTQLSLSARWNHTRVRNALGHPAPLQAEAFRYRKLNPAIGLTHGLSPALTLFGNLSQGTRVPTALELGCADPLQPCVLPTGLQADPYLRQVVARTLELGFRAAPADGVQLSGALFRTDSRDDIVFVRSGSSQAGYFTNVDRTRRQGVELSARGRRAGWDWQAGYTFLDATYQSEGVLPGPLSTADRPNRFMPGTPMAGLPRHVLKLAFDWRAAPGVTLGADWLAAASQPVAGNESDSRPALGRVAGYAVLNARAGWQLGARWQAYLRVNNLADRRYATFGAGAQDLFPGGQALQPGQDLGAARFIAPGAPRTLVAGLRYEWDR